MSRKQPQFSTEPKLQPRAAASKTLTSESWFERVPAADQRQALDRSIRSALARKQGPRTIARSLQLFQRYGIRVGAIRRYARQLRSARALPADGPEVRTLTKRSLTAMPYPTLRPNGHTLAQSALAVPSLAVARVVSLTCDRYAVAVRSPAAEPPKSWPLSFDPRPATRRSPSDPRPPMPEPRPLSPGFAQHSGLRACLSLLSRGPPVPLRHCRAYPPPPLSGLGGWDTLTACWRAPRQAPTGPPAGTGREERRQP